MKVVILGQYPLDPEKRRGGIETCIIGLMSQLKNYPDIELHIVTTQVMWRNLTKTVDNVTIHYLASPPLPRFVAAYTIDKFNTAKKLNELCPDIVHAHTTIQGYYALKSGYLTITTIHGLASDEYDQRIQPGLVGELRRKVILPMEEYVFKNSKILTVLGHETKKGVENLFKNDIEVVPNGIDEEWFNVENKEKEGRILYVGRIVPIKCIEHILQAISIIKNKKDIKLHIVGPYNENKTYFKYLQKYIQESDLSGNVEFIGSLHGEKLKNEYAECSIFILASKKEQCPLVLLEAMACRKPIIASNVGNVSSLVKDGISGFLFKHGDINYLANKIDNLFENRETRYNMGEIGVKMAKQLDWGKIATKYHLLYKSYHFQK